MPDRYQHPPLEDALDRYWDAVLAGEAEPAQGDLPPDLAAAVQRVHALDAAPAPRPVYASTLWEHLMLTHTASPSLASHPGSTLAVHPLPAPMRGATRPPQSLSRLAAAVLLVALLASSAFVALYPLRLWKSDRLPMVAAPTTVVATPENEGAVSFEFLWEYDGGDDRLRNPYGMGVDAEGNLWIIDAGNDRIQIVAPDGTHLETWGTNGSGEGEFEFLSRQAAFGLPYGDIAFDGDGNIYVADTGNARIQKFSPDRTFLHAWGTAGEGEGQFLVPISVVVGENGVVYVSDERRNDIQMFDQDGHYLGAFGGSGSAEGELSIASGLAIDGAGDVWVADWENDRVQRFTATGELLAVWGEFGHEDGYVNGPSDVVVDERGRVFVADDMNNRLQAFTEDGEFLAVMGGAGSDVGRFLYAVGIALGPDGTVYVSDRTHVQAFRLIPADT